MDIGSVPGEIGILPGYREVTGTRLGSKNGREGKMAKLTVSATESLGRPKMDRSDDGVEGDLRRR